ncbi:hypothetical protein GU926_01180 [Nibribacter ruber]|uniref:histidine kinase n=1 Tax=Nibribacter ruber TaxID=2698458 RepID=A0A6P1NWX1_9BACT|nr:ATP-binding protein [Nibribacter ruber]QHL86131.1 hypothetical protein GU926_01180 [Nibribacter ruber]
MSQEVDQTCQEQLNHLREEYEEFAYIVSHDLKAPLRAICNLSAWISEDLGQDIDPEVGHNIQLLQNRAERMERMINAILAFSRVNRLDLELQEVNVRDLVEEAAAPFIKSRGLVVHLDQLPTLFTYAKKLETVITKLLENAVHFNQSPTPEVTVSAQEVGDVYKFTVKDNGIGMAQDSLEKIFKLFYTVQPKDEQESLGAGLTIVKKIIQFVGGSIDVDSATGQGTTFQFTWPKNIQ